jgi:hypothetical protein
MSAHVPKSAKSAALNGVRGAGTVVVERPDPGIVVPLVIG